MREDRVRRNEGSDPEREVLGSNRPEESRLCDEVTARRALLARLRSAGIDCLYPLVASAFVLRYYLGEGRSAFSRHELSERRNGFWGHPAADVQSVLSEQRPVWVHASAAGETAAAHPLIDQLRSRLPGIPLALSSGMLEGQAMARRMRVDADALFFFPLDLPGIVGGALRRVRPSAFVMVESELWPNFLRSAKRRRIPVALVNGDMFDWNRQDKFPKWVRPFYERMLEAIDAIGAKSEADARNFEALGVPPDRLRVTGECKVDALSQPLSVEERRNLAREFGLEGRFPILVAGSTHAGEEEPILEAFLQVRSRHPEAALVLGPAELGRVRSIAHLAEQRGLRTALLSRQASAGGRIHPEVIILDVIGYLSRVYALGSVAVLGGSFVPGFGLHNIWEPFAQGKPVLYGPHMVETAMLADFESRGLTFRVSDAQHLADRTLALCGDSNWLESLRFEVDGEVGRHRGASARNAELVCELLARHRGERGVP